ncbi:MAG: glycosyltransferase family 4 protein, partial [Moorea sp. SIO3C2]|nr:glycosyltransferase family 4 protein [Moorena sp. SIO3C2]
MLVKIAVIGSKGLPPKQGGIEHHCAEIYPRIVAQGHDVDLYARSSYTQMSAQDIYDYEGVRVTSIPSLPFRGLDALLTSALAAIIASTRNYDVIHFHALGPSLFSWIPRLFSPRSKVVVTCHGLDWQRAKWGKLSSFLIRSGEWM